MRQAIGAGIVASRLSGPMGLDAMRSESWHIWRERDRIHVKLAAYKNAQRSLHVMYGGRLALIGPLVHVLGLCAAPHMA